VPGIRVPAFQLGRLLAPDAGQSPQVELPTGAVINPSYEQIAEGCRLLDLDPADDDSESGNGEAGFL
jgi:hypothetical protein